jgi:tRNA-modifying protein YgfZ
MAVVQDKTLAYPGQSETMMADDLSGYQLIEVAGEDARTFLSNLSTSDVKLVSPTFSQFSAICDTKGRVMASFIIFKRGEAYYLFLPASMVETLVRKLKMHVLRSKVVIAEAGASLRMLGLSGGNSAALLSDALPAPIEMESQGQVVQCGDYTVLLLPGLNQPRWLVVSGNEAIGQLREKLQAQVTPITWDDWCFADAISGVPFITPATAGEYLPQMLNLEALGGLSFTKGCYPGQEVIARLHYRGKLKRRSYVAFIDAESLPDAGTQLYRAEESGCIGHVLSSARHANGQVALQAVIEIEQQSQAEVFVASATGPKLVFTEQI